MITINEKVISTHPGASLGALVVTNIKGPADEAAWAEAAGHITRQLSDRYGHLSRAEIKKTAPAEAYVAYYKRFSQSYHLLGQLDSVLSGKKNLTSAPSLPAAMFMAEMESLLLTAGHDLNSLDGPLEMVVTGSGEEYVGLSGRDNKTVADDLGLRDSRGLISTILKGPDQHSRLTAETDRALFIIYGPPGVATAALDRHLDRLAQYVRLTAGQATVELREILTS